MIDSYIVSPTAYIGHIACNFAGRFWWLLLVPLGFFVAGASDWRWAVVGLIVLLLLFPMAITTALMAEAMRPEVARRAASRRASIDGRTITLYKEVSDDDGQISYEQVETAEISSAELTGRFFAIILNTARHTGRDFVLIPADAIPAQLANNLIALNP